MAKLYANENFPFPVVKALRRRKHDVVTIQETGKGEQAVPDEEVLAFAAGQDRCVLTVNRKDFIQLHRGGQGHAGIIVCTFDPDFQAQADRIHEAIGGSGGLAGKLIRVNRPHPHERDRGK
jgi:hypothetical protein